MSGSSAQAPHAGSEDYSQNSDVTRDRLSESHTDCSRSNKTALNNASAAGHTSETPLDTSTYKPHQHFHKQESLSLHQCGSNQSGSDSGLGGCTNSISSENSLIVNATGTEHTESVHVEESFNRSVESGKHHCRNENVSGRLLDDARCGDMIDAALDNLSNNKISYAQRSETSSSGSHLESLATINKSDTRYSKDSMSVLPLVKSNTSGPNLSSVSSSDGILRVDDAQKVKRSSRSIDGDVVSSTMTNDDSVSHVVPDKITGARNNATDHSHCNPPSTNVPKLRSALKRSTETSSDATTRSPKNRNVSFNQTVIVFCEEIETSLPGEFDPPIDYRDSPDCVDSALGVRRDRGDQKSTLAFGSNSYDLDLLSKIVGQDASKLTDEQLFRLLESSSFFQDSELNLSNNLDDDFFVQRLRSNQTYLCHDAISDSDSESSLVLEEPHSVTNQVSRNSDTRPAQTDAIYPNQERQVGRGRVLNSESQRNLGSGLKNDERGGKKVEQAQESGNRSTAIISQASLPARVRVATVENQSKKNQPSSKPSLTSQDLNDHQSIEVAQTQQKVIPSFNQLENLTNSHRVMIKQSNIDPVAVSRPHTLSDGNLKSNQQNRAQPLRVNVHKDQVSHVTPESGNSYRATINKVCCDKIFAPTKSDSHPPPFPICSRGEDSTNVQSAQTNPACHICMAIESNCKPPIMTSTPSLSTIDGVRQGLNNSMSRPEVLNSLIEKQATQQVIYQERDDNTSDSMNNRRILQPETSTQSCASCRELTLRQQHENLSSSSNMSRVTQPPGPIACQIVYVVDQNGNRIRALQMVRPPQTPRGNMAQPPRQLIGAPVTIRLPNPSTLPNEQTARRPVYVTQNDFSVTNRVPTSSALQSISRDACLLDARGFSKTRDAGSLISQTNPIAASYQQMPSQTQSGQKNHTIYYVRQPLGQQNLGNEPASRGIKPFPDVHEIRRLDGIRAPVVDGRMPRPHIDSRLNQALSEDRLCSQRDDSEDPSFGFSNRPAVKVVSSVNTDLMSAQQRIGPQNGLSPRNEQARGQVFASQTLDRQYRNYSKQEMTETMPNTSSMYEINQNLSSHTSRSVSKDGVQVRPKGDQQHPVNRDPSAYKSGNENAHIRSVKDPPKAEVAYIMNI